MIYDSFTFLNEYEMLDLRLNELDDVVDRFVIVESNTTFSGVKKPYNFLENKHLFEKFLHKIEYVQIDSPNKLDINMSKTYFIPYSRSTWFNEYEQRNSIIFGLTEANDNDIILISDLDEIPNKNYLEEAIEQATKEPIVLNQQFFYFYLNNAVMDRDNPEEIGSWFGTIAITHKDLLDTTPQDLRDKKHLLPRSKSKCAGWHYSFIGGSEKIKDKLESFSHVEFSGEKYTNEENILQALNNNKDIFDRDEYIYKTFPIEELIMPEYVINNLDKFSKFIKEAK